MQAIGTCATAALGRLRRQVESLHNGGAVLNRAVVMETPLRQDECLARLTANVKPIPGYATWWRWPRDKALWGAFSAEGFRVQLGRARQVTSAQGRFGAVPNGTRIAVDIGFKGWVILFGIFSAVTLVGIGVLIAAVFSDSSFALVVLVVAAFGFGSNFAVGLIQQRDLIRTIGRILDARQVEPRPVTSWRDAMSTPQAKGILRSYVVKGLIGVAILAAMAYFVLRGR